MRSLGFFFWGGRFDSQTHGWDLGWRDQLSQGLAASQELNLAGPSGFCARGWLGLFLHRLLLCPGNGEEFGLWAGGSAEVTFAVPRGAWNSSRWEI